MKILIIRYKLYNLTNKISGDDEDGDDDAEPGLTDYIMHYLTLPWKVKKSIFQSYII